MLIKNHKNRRPWFFQLNYLVVVLFLIGTTFLHGYGQARMLGIALASVALCFQVDGRLSVLKMRKPVEVILFVAWGAWSIITGIFVARIPFLMWYNATTLIQMVILLCSAYALFVRQKNVTYFYLTILAIAVIQLVAAHLGFHLGDVGSSREIVRDMVDNTKRVEGLTGNANAMGFAMLAGIWAAMLLWRKVGRFLRLLICPILICLMVCFSYYAIQSASRKSIMVLGLLWSGWGLWMLPGKLSIRSVIISVAIGVLLFLIGGAVIGYVMNDTVAGARFLHWFDAGGGSATEGFKEDIRYTLYVDGFKFWMSHPIAGIGLGQFPVWHWSGLYSHSDYMEPLACNGIVGFILYQGVAFTVTCRLIRLVRMNLPNDITYTLKGMIIFMVCNHYIIGFGCPHWMQLSHMVIVIFIGTYSWCIRQEVVRRRMIYCV